MGKLDPDDLKNLIKILETNIMPPLREQIRIEVLQEIDYRVKQHIYQLAAEEIKKIVREHIENNISVDIIVRSN